MAGGDQYELPGSRCRAIGKDVVSLRRRRLSEIINLFVVLALIVSSLPATAAKASYKIKQGDTLWTIAARHHTTVAKLAKANHLRENSVLSLGKAVCIPGKASLKQPSRAARPSRQACYTVHANADNVCLRSGGDSSSRKIMALSRGTTMKLLARNGKWAKVALPNGTCGFAYRPLLAVGAGSSKSAARIASSQPDRSSCSLIQTALACRGAHYRRGGTSRGGFDCSGFTRYIFAKYGISLPHSSAAQAGRGTSVCRGELKPGNLVFFATSRRGISHVGIYVGNGSFVHAESRGKGVTVDSLGSSYYSPRYRGARRVD